MSRDGRNKRRRGQQATLAGSVLAILIAIALQSIGPAENNEEPSSATAAAAASPDSPTSAISSPDADADARIEAAVRDERSGFMITVDSEVLKLLPDDEEGSRHQRFLIELKSGRTLLVAHNIDLAPRVPAQRGDPLRVHAQYEWNERGGLLHWTHDDPDGHHEGGWIERAGRRYQ